MELILHQYDFSNYAEKVRLALGYKGLSWRAVEIPPVAPKPELVPLTGGYRRTPVLQIGADIYCDTRLILRVLDRLAPKPTLYPENTIGLANAISYWAENQLFRPISLYVSGTNADVLPPNLQADRSAMRGLPPPDAATMERAARRNAPLVRAGLTRVADMLADGRDWILGDAVTIADFSVYHALWFITGRTTRLAHEIEPLDTIKSWMTRMRAFGHGHSEPMSPTEALDVAAASEPALPAVSAPFAEDPAIGSTVRIRADDYGRDTVEGDLVYLDADEIAIQRSDPRVGDVIVHFPRLGYDLRALNLS
ncbi:MAG: glutathione S-transferase family protein [Pseudomonadota bacterium]